MRANGGVQMFVPCSAVFSRLLLLSYFCEWSWESILCLLGLVSVSDYRMWRKKFNRTPAHSLPCGAQHHQAEDTWNRPS